MVGCSHCYGHVPPSNLVTTSAHYLSDMIKKIHMRIHVYTHTHIKIIQNVFKVILLQSNIGSSKVYSCKLYYRLVLRSRTDMGLNSSFGTGQPCDTGQVIYILKALVSYL